MQPTAQVIIRMPFDLYTTLKKRAEQEGCSLNKLVIALLTRDVTSNVKP